ncbi:hypothetical protein ACSTLD_23790, partial [Vibrio parahaemolyticus]
THEKGKLSEKGLKGIEETDDKLKKTASSGTGSKSGGSGGGSGGKKQGTQNEPNQLSNNPNDPTGNANLNLLNSANDP